MPAGLVSNIQLQHAEALFNAMQQALQQAQAQLRQAALPSHGYRCACCRNHWFLLPGSGMQPAAIGSGRHVAACLHCGEDAQQLHYGDLAAAGAPDPEVLSQSIGTTEEGAEEDDSEDGDEGDESGSDDDMSQDSNSQGVDDGSDDPLDISDDDSMQSGSEESDDVS
jgi:hypothetical protein